MNNLLKVKNSDVLVRDMSTGAILNNNASGYEAYLAQRDRIRSQREQIAQQEEKINNITSELSDIKQILLSILEKNDFKG